MLLKYLRTGRRSAAQARAIRPLEILPDLEYFT
jgi:hypothetical protein